MARVGNKEPKSFIRYETNKFMIEKPGLGLYRVQDEI
jgi:hypothetical protein